MNDFESYLSFEKNLGEGNVVERWASIGFLDGIDEEDKKYLADLYESLAMSLLSKDNTINSDEISNNIQFNILKATRKDDTIYKDEDIDEFLSVVLFAVIRSVYSVNKTFSFNEFVECLNNVKVDNSFINNCLSSDKNGLNGELEYASVLSEKIIEKLNK